MAESEKLARQTAETQKANAADQLAKRATEMADRLTGSATASRCGSESRRQASLPVEMPASAFAAFSLSASPTTTPTSPATELLLKRIQDLVDRAAQAEEQLQIEQAFSNLHKEACEEKRDQLLERVSRIYVLSNGAVHQVVFLEVGLHGLGYQFYCIL